jgi:polyhydroxyalkanoate synthesis regulator phasin
MKKKVKPLLTSILAGAMLLGTASMAMASTDCSSTAAAGSCTTYTQNQTVKTPDQAGQKFNFNNPIKINYVTFEQLSTILDGLVTDGTISSDQEDAILYDITDSGRITKYQLYDRLSELVSDGTLSKAEMKVILSALPTQNITIQPVQNHAQGNHNNQQNMQNRQ